MPDIEVTEDQRERLRDVQEALADEVVGKYGIVRTRDAVEYLLDRYEADDGIEPNVVEEDAEPASAVETDDAADGESDASDDESEDGSEEPGDGDGEREDGADEESEEEDDEDDADAGDEESEEEDDEDDADADPATNGGGDMLSAMQSLLDDHDDKWGEGSGDDRYEVELPDGSTESARTKDDVRALLFEHYR